MRKLLLAALGAAGSLLVDLPALAQLSNATSTFSGQVAANCSFNLPENIALTYYSNLNRMAVFEEFELTTNISPVRIHASRLVVVSEPPPYASEITAHLYIYDFVNQVQVVATKSYEDSQGQEFSFSTTNPNSFWIDFQVRTQSRADNSERYELPSGDYSYRTTISCLQ